MVVRELLAVLGFKVDKKSEQGIKGTLGKVKKIAGALAAVFLTGRIARSINAVVTETAALGDRLDKTSQKLGVTAQALQELRFAAEQNGVAVNQFDVGLQRFIRRASEAADGTGVAKDALKDLGVQLRDNQGNLRPVEDLLGDVAEGFKNTETQADRVKLAFKLFDTEGVALVNVLQQGRGALEGFRARARELGGILDEELIELSARYTDTVNEQNKALQGIKNVIAKLLLPIWLQFAEGVRDLAIQMRGPFRRALKVIIETFRGILRTVSFIIRGWIALNDLVVSIADDFLGFNRTLTQFAIVLGVITALLGLKVVLIGLIVIAIGLLIDDFIALGEGGESVTGTLIKGFQDLVTELGGVGPAIQQVLATTIEFWLKLLGVSEENAPKIAEAITNPFRTVLRLLEQIRELMDDILAGPTIEKLRELALEVAGEKILRGPAARAQLERRQQLRAAQIQGGTGGTTLTNAPQTNVEVNVRAEGAQAAPEAIASEVGKVVDRVMDARNREAASQLALGVTAP
jgi:hypothetical protein